jgi:hypothetical protein
MIARSAAYRALSMTTIADVAIAHAPGHRLDEHHRAVADCAAAHFVAYSVTFDGRVLGVGESADACPGVRLVRRG